MAAISSVGVGALEHRGGELADDDEHGAEHHDRQSGEHAQRHPEQSDRRKLADEPGGSGNGAEDAGYQRDPAHGAHCMSDKRGEAKAGMERRQLFLALGWRETTGWRRAAAAPVDSLRPADCWQRCRRAAAAEQRAGTGRGLCKLRAGFARARDACLPPAPLGDAEQALARVLRLGCRSVLLDEMWQNWRA